MRNEFTLGKVGFRRTQFIGFIRKKHGVQMQVGKQMRWWELGKFSSDCFSLREIKKNKKDKYRGISG